MSSLHIALATCAAFHELDEDDRLLRPAFDELGVTAQAVVWDDATVRWDQFDAVVLRSTWDYAERHQQFVDWVTGVAGVTVLLNPAPLVRWNLDKGYLGVLHSGGVPTVPTSYVHPGGYLHLPDTGQFVLKPAISAGSRDTARYDAQVDSMRAVGHAQRLLNVGRTVMIQPYLHSVDHDGETSLLFIGGEFSHAVRKGPLLQLGSHPTEELFAEEEITPRDPAPAQLEVALAALSALPPSLGSPVYARVDLLQTPRGPVLLELELAEPSLFLTHGAGAANRLARAVCDRL
ncbi:hypothetical protein BH24ACT15_BH24ACT15_25080 [soil metagenome]